jgi:hypothetical protein
MLGLLGSYDVVVAGAGAIEVGPEHKPKGDPNGRGHPGYVLGVRISDGKELWTKSLTAKGVAGFAGGRASDLGAW